VLLPLILLLAFVLRAWNLDWDRGTKLQPDERFWSSVAAYVETPETWDWDVISDPDQSPLNPRTSENIPNYVYGTLPLWASEAAAGVLMTDTAEPLVTSLDGLGINLVREEPAGDSVSQRLRFSTGYDVTIIGRLMSALVDTLTVLAVYFLATALADRRTGLLAAFLQALTVLHIQYSHFLGSEPWVALFVTVAVFGSVQLARNRAGWPTRLLTALAVGLAIASKLSGVAVVAAPALAALVLASPELPGLFRSRIAPGVVGRIARVLERFVVMGLVAIVAYRVAQPYDFQAGFSLVMNQDFSDDLVYLEDINQGGNWPWVQPLVGATPLVHPLKQMFLWGMGPGLALAGFGGMALAAVRFRKGEHYWAVPLAVIGAYFLLVSLQFYAIIRYLQPAYPTITALGAVALMSLWRWASDNENARAAARWLARAAVVVSVGATAFWAAAFVNGVYNNDNARLAAGDWMLENLPADAVLSQQSWDDGLPFGNPGPFGRVTLEPFSFGGDAPDRIELLLDGLDQVDYVVESSNKFYDALPRTPARFPQMTEYYERLFDGSLGFELVRTFQNQPTLFGITIDDTSAEEAFTLYDHPTVFIWKKTDAFSIDEARHLLNPDRARTAINAEPKDAGANAGQLRPDAYDTQQQGSSFADVHVSNSSGLLAALSWFIALQLAAFAVAPFVLRYAGRSAGAAWGVTKAAGMLALSVPVWFVVAKGWLTMSTGLVLAAMLGLLAVGVATAWLWRRELVNVWQQHRRMIVATEVVFALVFVAVLVLRFTNPDVWHPWRGGEKPMELAYFTAVTGSTTLPPYDPWFAGGSLNYYYFGWFVLSVPTRLIGLMPDVAFNLGVATYAAVAAVTVFSMVALLIDLANRRQGQSMSRVRTGLLGVILFLIAGNLDGFRQLLRLLRERFTLNPVTLSNRFDWWDPSRVNKNSPGLEVTEFPSFTVLFADLHPHFMAMGFFGLCLITCFALIERARHGQRRATWILTVVLGLLTGVMRMVHTWDLPTVIVAAGASIVVGWLLAAGPLAWRAQTALLQLVALGVVHLVFTGPYRANNQVSDSGFHRSESVTNLDDFLVHWGVFLFVGVLYWAVRLSRLLRAQRAQRALLVEATPEAFDEATEASLADEASNTVTFIAAGIVGLAGWAALHLQVGSVAAWCFAGLCASLALFITELRARPASTAHVIVAACWTLGLGVLVGVELFTQNADIARLNTVFKFWLQVWHLFAVATAFGVATLLSRPDRSEAPVEPVPTVPPVDLVRQDVAPTVQDAAPDAVLSPDPQPVATGPQGRSAAQQAFGAVFAVLLLAAMVYPVLSVLPRQANRIDTTLGPSLNGQLWLQPGQHVFEVRDARDRIHEIDPGRDREIIEWLRDNVQGRPTIVEGVGGAEYQWWSRITINTGLPSVLGWRWHQDQQRTLFNAKVNERKADVADFYRATSQQDIDSFLRAYDVSYVIVGSIEEAMSPPETRELLKRNPSLRAVWSRGDLAIYEVAKESLAHGSVPIASIGPG